MQLPPVLSPLDRPVALFILLALLSVFEPVLVLLAVRHGGTFETLCLSLKFLLKLLLKRLYLERRLRIGVLPTRAAKPPARASSTAF
jgi:hypothetical protein